MRSAVVLADLAKSVLEKLAPLGPYASAGLFLVVFAESGLFFGFFLPGDSLLFTAGLLSSNPDFNLWPWYALAIGCAVSAVAGDQVGYMFGAKVGSSLFKRPDSRFFKQEYLEKAEAFFEKHGNKAIILARFVPIVRTFCPIVAGASKMHYRNFVTYNVIGGTIWGAGFIIAGWQLGKIEFLQKNIEYVAIVIVAVSVLPIVIEVLRHRRQAAALPATADELV